MTAIRSNKQVWVTFWKKTLVREHRKIKKKTKLETEGLVFVLFFFFFMATGQLGFLGSSGDKESACNSGDPGLIPGLRRPPGERNGYPFQ